VSSSPSAGVATGAVAVDVAGAAREAVEAHLPALLRDHVAQRLAGRDADLWGPDGRAEAALAFDFTVAPYALDFSVVNNSMYAPLV
jgi:hypothetical protein